MSGEKPNYAAIIKSRKPVPTLDLEELRRRSAEATEATIVLQLPAGPPDGSRDQDLGGTQASPKTDEATRIEADGKEPVASVAVRIPLRFSVSKAEHHQLRIQAAVENRSVPELMRAIIADYLRANGRAP